MGNPQGLREIRYRSRVRQGPYVYKGGRNSDCFEKEPKKYSFELMTIANYFEGLATGVRQGFYNEAVVRDHLEAIMREFVEEFFYQPRMVRLGLNRDGFSSFIEMLESWKLDRPYYS
jgi:hypothetical protein